MLNRTQRLGLLLISPTVRSTPTRGMEVFHNIMPISLFVETEAIKTRLRLRLEVPQSWDGIGYGKKKRGHIFLLEKHLSKVADPQLPVSFSSPSRSSRPINTCFDYSLTPSNINCFTDGSKIEDNAGAGFAITSEDAVIFADSLYLGEATVFQSEVIAISCAASWLLENADKYKNRQIDFFSDSQACIKAIQKTTTTSSIVAECKDLLFSVNTNLNTQVRLFWVRGHNNNTGNELADALAKEGACSTFTGPSPIIPVSLSYINTTINNFYREKWQDKWNKLASCRQTKIFSPTICAAKAKAIRSLDRFSAGRVVQFLTGHIALNRHLFIMGIDDLRNCRLCGEDDTEETPDHLLNHCPALELDRRNILTASNLKARIRQISEFIQFSRIADLFRMQLDDDIV